MASETLIIIPAYNEERRLPEVLAAVRGVVPGAAILVVDDGSRDATVAVARRAGVRVAPHPFNLGYGAALETGYRYALHHGYARVIQMDADGQHRPESLAVLAAALEAGADLVLGSRFLGERGYRPPAARRIGIWLFSLLVRLATGQAVTDATTGFQGLSRALIRFYADGGDFPPDYPDANMLVRAARAGFRLQEVAVRMQANPEGGTLHVGWKPVLYVANMLFAVALEASRPRRRREGG